MNKLFWGLTLLCLVAFTACSEKSTAGQDIAGDTGTKDSREPPDLAEPDEGGEDTPDAGVEDTVPADLPEETVVPDVQVDSADPAADSADSADSQDEVVIDDFGFTIRVPQVHTVECNGGPPGFQDELEQLDTDHICTFDYDGVSGHIYIQATATSCNVLMSPVPFFDVVGAWLSVDGQLTELENPEFFWGGNHHNDFAMFETGGNHFKYWHSTFGFGWRACEPMDCIVVSEPGPSGPGDLIENGCKPKERSLPVICVQVTEDGTYPPLTDNFAPCNGDNDWD